MERTQEIVTGFSQLPPYQQRAIMMFSEATKKNMGAFKKDATGVGWAIQNRLNRPERFGENMFEVLSKRDQFSPMWERDGAPVIDGERQMHLSSEFIKAYEGATTGEFTDESDGERFKHVLRISSGIEKGAIDDTTGGADHFYNPERANPFWARVYGKTYKTEGHHYHSEQDLVKDKKGRTFFDALSKARDKNQKTFTWDGDRWNTEDYP